MVCFNSQKPKMRGGYEIHAISLAPSTFGERMNFMGPGTNLEKRLNPDGTPKQDSIPIRPSDWSSYRHDVEYRNIKNDYLKNPTPQNRQQQLNKIWEADDKFINEMKNDSSEPMAKIAGKLIGFKKMLSK